MRHFLDTQLYSYLANGTIARREWLQAVEAGRERFLGQIRRLMKMVMPNYRRIGDPLFSAEWQAVAGRTPGDNLDAPFVFQTAVLRRAIRIRCNLGKHPSDYLDYLQLRLLDEQGFAFITADRKLAMMTSRSLQSDRIYTWDELISPQTRQ